MAHPTNVIGSNIENVTLVHFHKSAIVHPRVACFPRHAGSRRAISCRLLSSMQAPLFLVVFESFSQLLNGLANGLDGLDSVSAEIMSGSFKFVLGFLQLLDCSPDVLSIPVILLPNCGRHSMPWPAA
jgi:hypothetical protein